MKTLKIRELRGSRLEEHARAGELVGLTRDRALIAVVVPMGQAWVEHVIEHNWSRVLQGVTRGEMEMSRGVDMVTLEDVLASAAERDAAEQVVAPGPARHPLPKRQLVAAGRAGRQTVGGSVHQLAADAGKATAALGPIGAPAAEMIKRLTAALAVAEPDQPSIISSATVGIRDLSARRIEQAGEDRELLVLTNDRALVGIVVPVSRRLVEFLVSQNLSRVMYNIQRAEEQAAADEPFVTLEEALGDKSGDDPTVGTECRGR